MSDKEFVLIGRCQSKTRDYIKYLESQNTKANKEIEKLANIIKEVRELCENKFIMWEVNNLGGKIKIYAPISTNEIMEILDKEVNND